MDAGMGIEGKRKLYLGSLFIGIAVGAVIGGGMALLFAPKSGRETRDLIRDKAVESGHTIQKKAGDVKAKAGQIGRAIRSKDEKEREDVKQG